MRSNIFLLLAAVLFAACVASTPVAPPPAPAPAPESPHTGKLVGPLSATLVSEPSIIQGVPGSATLTFTVVPRSSGETLDLRVDAPEGARLAEPSRVHATAIEPGRPYALTVKLDHAGTGIVVATASLRAGPNVWVATAKLPLGAAVPPPRGKRGVAGDGRAIEEFPVDAK